MRPAAVALTLFPAKVWQEQLAPFEWLRLRANA
jgi:hypothetical protein